MHACGSTPWSPCRGHASVGEHGVLRTVARDVYTNAWSANACAWQLGCVHRVTHALIWHGALPLSASSLLSGELAKQLDGLGH
eukprot:11268347-Alexandrium_andersonii.AAC.1